MRRIIFLGIFILIFSSIVSATAISNDEFNNIQLSGAGAYGQVMLWNKKDIQVMAYQLEPETMFTLVYIEEQTKPNRVSGSSYTNFPYPRVKCVLQEMESSEYGTMSYSWKLNFQTLTKDKKKQTFYLVESSDVLCRSGRMKKWNSENYMKAESTI